MFKIKLLKTKKASRIFACIAKIINKSNILLLVEKKVEKILRRTPYISTIILYIRF
jgi:hypothetical protein